MEKQRIYFAPNKKKAQQIAEMVLTKEGKLTHNLLSLSMQEPTVWKLILETCPRKSLTLQEDFTYLMS